MSEKPKPFVRLVTACFFFLIAILLNILLPLYWHNTPEIIKHLLLVFSAIMCVHIIEYTYLWWEIFGHIKTILKETLQATHQLIDDNKRSLEKSLHTANQLIGSASLCGLTNIYRSRKEIKGEIYDAIENAEKRIWLLGVTLSENIHLDELLPILNKKIIHGINVKILLLDALQCSAVFRMFLESTGPEIAKIVSTDRTKTQPGDPYFYQQLYSDFAHACDKIKSYPHVDTAVRFYTHTPTCWMMIVDNMVHFQPYTFGRGTDQHSTNLCIGANMPILKFQMQSKGKPFEILEDHFMKLWLTSDLDLFHIEAKLADRHRIINDIFNFNSSWFKQIYETLYAQKDISPLINSYGKVPGRPWKWEQPLLSISLQDETVIPVTKKRKGKRKKKGNSIPLEDETAIQVTVGGYSRNSISLKSEAANLPLHEGQIVILQGTPPVEPLEANFLLDYFLKIKKFIITRIVPGQPLTIELEAVMEEGEYKELYQANYISAPP
jgi:hypothetical protein